MNLEQLMRNRIARLTLAVTLIVLSLWAFTPYMIYRVAPSAFVNSSLIRVTAPIPGRLAQTLPEKGDFLAQAVNLTLIEARSPDQRQFLDLQRQYTLAKKNSELAKRQLEEIATLDQQLAQRATDYHDAAVKRLESTINETKAEQAGCFAVLKQRREVGSRITELTRSGHASEVRSAEALATQEAASARCDVVGVQLTRLEVELEAARKGIFLHDGTNDVPYSQQQRDRMVLRRQELEMQALQESLRASQLAAEIEAERDRMKSLASYKINLPAGHVVWSTAASPGSAVTEGQTILDLADCKRRFLVVELPEREFEQINTGDVASVRLIGDEHWQQGWVQQVRGSAARADDRLFAAQMPNANPGTISVELALPAKAVTKTGGNYCDIGRLAEVRFQRKLFGLADLFTRKPPPPSESPDPRAVSQLSADQ